MSVAGERGVGTGHKPGLSRRELFKTSFAAAGGFAVGASCDARASTSMPKLTPVFYPITSFTPDVDLDGKWVVITGASRGNGRATGEALHALGATVIGTTRDVSKVSDVPSFELHNLDIADSTSIDKFMKTLKAKTNGTKKIDVLINNAGRGVWGFVATRDNAHAATRNYHMRQLRLATEVIFHGHVRMTNEILPLMPTSGYARILFTVTGLQYCSGGNAFLDPNTGLPSGLMFNFLEPYISAKRALGAYVNTLRIEMLAGNSNIRVTSVNPVLIKTELMDGTRPIYLDPTDASGYMGPTPFDPYNLHNSLLHVFRQAMNGALPASLVGDANAQLLRMNNPPPNVLAGNTDPAGEYPFFELQLMAENAENAIIYGCG